MIFKRFLFLPVLILIFSCTSTIETDILIPISIENIPKGLTITGPPLKGLEIRVRGSESLIASLSEMNLQYKLDLSLVNVGVESIQIQREGILLPQGVSIVSLTQSFLAVRIEHEIIKEVPVIVSVSGQPASGPYSIDPSCIDIEIKGPANILDQIDPDKDIKIFVDLKDLKPGEYVKRASIKIPVQTTLTGVKPEVFTVRVR